MYFSQQCRINVGGKAFEQIEEDNSNPPRIELDKVKVDFSIKSLDQEGDVISVQIKFGQAINMAYIRENNALSQMFEVSWYPTSGLQSVPVNGTVTERYYLEPLLVVAEFNRIFFDVNLGIGYSVDGVMTVRLRGYFDTSMIFLTDPNLTEFSNQQAREPFSFRFNQQQPSSLLNTEVISN